MAEESAADFCYHGISRYDEHVWRPSLYMHPEVLLQRLEILKQAVQRDEIGRSAAAPAERETCRRGAWPLCFTTAAMTSTPLVFQP